MTEYVIVTDIPPPGLFTGTGRRTPRKGITKLHVMTEAGRTGPKVDRENWTMNVEQAARFRSYADAKRVLAKRLEICGEILPIDVVRSMMVGRVITEEDPS